MNVRRRPGDPPRMAHRLLWRCLPRRHRDAIIGDLDEEYRRHVTPALGRRGARWWYWRQALTSLQPFVRRRNQPASSGRGHFGGSWLAQLATDLRIGARTLSCRPAFIIGAVVLLAVGIGGTTAMFSVVNAVLIRPLPYADAHELMSLRPIRPGAEQHRYTFSEGEFLTYQERNVTLRALAAFESDSRVAHGSSGDPVQVSGARVTASLFDVLGEGPAIGRLFQGTEDRPGAAPVVVLSFALWQQLFGGAPDVVGTTIDLGAQPTTVVGVMPPGFRFPDGETMYWSPLRLDRVDVGYQSGQILQVVGRRVAGISAARVQDDLDRISTQITAESLTRYPGMRARAVELAADLAAPARSHLLLSLAVVGLVLLLVCCNVAGSLLAHGVARRRELAVRRALGASTGRLIRQLVGESVVLAACGGALGIGVSTLSLRLLNAARPEFLVHVGAVGIDLTVLGFAVAATSASVLLFGLAPAVMLTRSETGSLPARHGVGPQAQRFLSLLVTAQIAACVVLLVGAALMLQTMVRESAVDPGFSSERVVTFRISLPPERYDEVARINAFYARALDELRRLPYVEEAAAITRIPLGGMRSVGYAWQEGRPYDPNDFPQELNMRWATAEYFEAMRIELLDGRSFDGTESATGPLVVIVSASLADALWPDESAVGKRFKLGRLVDADTPWRTVVGVVGEVNQDGLREGRAPTAYFAATQRGPSAMSVVARVADHDSMPASQDAVFDGIRAAVTSVDPAQPIYDVRYLRELVAGAGATTRAATALFGGFALLAVILAAVGLHALIEYSVRQRVHEIGVRRALGATRAGILALIMVRASRLTAAGLAGGTVGAIIATRFLEALVFGVSATDPATFAATGSAVGLIALAVSLIPARRATRISPDESLRS